MPTKLLPNLLEGAISAREILFDENHQTGFRLFNGFTEGYPHLVVDLYARTILIHNYTDTPSARDAAVWTAQNFLQMRMPWVQCIIVKTRNENELERCDSLPIEITSVGRDGQHKTFCKCDCPGYSASLSKPGMH